MMGSVIVLNYGNMENELNKEDKFIPWTNYNNYTDYLESLPKVEMTEELKKQIAENLNIVYNPINLNSLVSNT
jgi:hypothetical protein